jgi:hypothetical protein
LTLGDGCVAREGLDDGVCQVPADGLAVGDALPLGDVLALGEGRAWLLGDGLPGDLLLGDWLLGDWLLGAWLLGAWLAWGEELAGAEVECDGVGLL